MSRSRRSSFTVIVGAYAAAVAVFVAVAAGVGTDSPAWAVAGGYAASTAVLYLLSQVAGNGSTFDAWWSVMPSVATVWLAVGADDGDPWRRTIVTVLVLVWGVRLTYNWAVSWPGLHHEDWRYRQLYATTPLPRWAVSLLAVHAFPTAVVTIASLPLVAAMTRSGDLDVLDAIAAAVIVGAVTVETIADNQLRAFNRTKAPGDVLDTGLWARSRHPNYLGETGFWWGLWLFAVAAEAGAWWTVVGPVAITVMFLAASIPMIEERSAERRPGWADYAARTPMLVPRPARAR